MKAELKLVAATVAAAPRLTLHPQVEALVKRLRVRHEGRLLQAVINDELGRVQFVGAATGTHGLDLSCSPVSRILAHWEGYLEANGLDPRATVGGAYWFDGRGHRHLERVVVVTRIGARGTSYGRNIYRSGRVGAEGHIRRS